MWRLLLVVVVGCNIPSYFGGPFGEPDDEQPWQAETLITTRAGTVVAETRLVDEIPDEMLDYRILVVDRPWRLLAEGSMQANHWDGAIVRAPGRLILHLFGTDCVIDDDQARCGQP